MLLFLVALFFAAPLPARESASSPFPVAPHVVPEEGRSLLLPIAIGTTAVVGAGVYGAMKHPDALKSAFNKLPKSVSDRAARVIDSTGKFGNARLENVKGFIGSARTKVTRFGTYVKDTVSGFWHKIRGPGKKVVETVVE